MTCIRNKRQISMSFEARLRTLNDYPHLTSIARVSTNVINTVPSNSDPSLTTPPFSQFQIIPTPLFSTPTSILSDISYPTLKPSSILAASNDNLLSTVIPIPSLTITYRITRSTNYPNDSIKTEKYSNSSPFDYNSPYRIPAIIGTTVAIFMALALIIIIIKKAIFINLEKDTSCEQRGWLKRFNCKSFAVLDNKVENDNSGEIKITIDVPEKTNYLIETNRKLDAT